MVQFSFFLTLWKTPQLWTVNIQCIWNSTLWLSIRVKFYPWHGYYIFCLFMRINLSDFEMAINLHIILVSPLFFYRCHCPICSKSNNNMFETYNSFGGEQFHQSLFQVLNAFSRRSNVGLEFLPIKEIWMTQLEEGLIN